MIFSMEGEKYYPQIKLTNMHYYAAMSTTSFKSQVPVPYFSWAEYNIQRKHVPLRSTIQKPVFVANNCASRNNREKLVKALMDAMPVDSVSKCLNNIKLSADEKRDKKDLMRRYALYLAFENQKVDDYITEKLWGRWPLGAAGVLRRCKCTQHVPKNSVIFVSDYPSVTVLAEHLKNVLEDEDLYESYHSWRYKPLPGWFVEKYNFTHVHSECRTCEWAAAQL